MLCAIADVSRKCYYAFLKKAGAGNCPSDEFLKKAISEIQREKHHSMGYRQMNIRLREMTGARINAKKTYRLMQESGNLSAVRRRKWSPEVYMKRRELKELAPPDLLKRDFTSDKPLRKFVTDNTYLYGKERKGYVNIVMDLFNREIVAYSISETQDAGFCIKSIEIMTEKYGEKLRGSILHSDLGSVFMSVEYRRVLEEHGIRQSAGDAGICYDNAAMESFNGILKTEGLYSKFGKTRVKDNRIAIRELEEETRKFIEYYNVRRAKGSLGGLSPVEYREEYEKEGIRKSH